MRRLKFQPVAASIFILGCAAFALLVLVMREPASVRRPPSVATATPSPSALTPTPSPPPAAPAPIWADEFTGPAGQPPSELKWNHDLGGDGWGNGEWEYYTASTANAALDGAGNLVITARRPARPAGLCAAGPCDITSARLQTDGTFQTTYGRIEARIQTPAGRGLWPAFWLVSADDTGELDIMEQNGREPDVISGTAHVYGYTPPAGLTSELRLPTATTDFHIYAIDWTPDRVVWSVDGRAYHTVRKADVGASHWVFDRPYYILLNLAVGSADPGYPDATTPFPARLVVDYVRVYK